MDADRCPRCGYPDRAPHEIVSRHATADGVVVYSRCRCGRLQVHRDGSVLLRAGRRTA